VYALYERFGGAEPLAAMELAQAQDADGAAYLRALMSRPIAAPSTPAVWQLADLPTQADVDRVLSVYEAYARVLDVLSRAGQCRGSDGRAHR
jgi:hypothetical protein